MELLRENGRAAIPVSLTGCQARKTNTPDLIQTDVTPQGREKEATCECKLGLVYGGAVRVSEGLHAAVCRGLHARLLGMFARLMGLPGVSTSASPCGHMCFV